jgi:hypothetical protein
MNNEPPQEIKKRSKANRFLITVDQIGEGEEKLQPFEFEPIKQKLREKYGNKISYLCIGREKHKEKGWHTHIWLQLVKRIDYTLESFNFICEKKANVKIVGRALKDRIRSLSYTRKGGDYIEFGKRDEDIDLSKQEVKNVNSYVIKAIQEGIGLERLLEHEIEQVREYAINNSKKIKQMIYELENLQHTKEMQRLNGIEEIDITKLRKDYREIAKILNKAENKRPHKTLNLHLWSREPNMGKTSLVEKIQSCSPCYIFPPDGWFTRYTNYIYQFIIWDEVSFEGLKPTFLNLFLEGAKCQMPVKGDLTHKWDNPLVIMLSNKPIREHLEELSKKRNKEIFEKTLGVRVKEIELTKPLFKFIELIKPKATAAAVD